jgi:pectinesterase inhibitor-like protein
MEGSYFSTLTTILILIVYAIYINPCLATRPIPTKTNTQFIKTSCGNTTYPELCFSSLSSYANEIQTSPKSLASIALSVTLTTTRSTLSTIAKLSKSQGLTPGEAAAMSDCMEVLNDSVEELQSSIGEMGNAGGKNFELQMNDIQTWVSTSLTDEDTCIDGFGGNAMNGNVKNTVRSHIVKVAEMTSNALALINSFAATQNLIK